MSGFSVWFQKELLEIWRTWRIWVIPGMLLFFAISSPILAEITPDLLRSMATDEPGVVIELPDPVALDAIRQWAQSLSQIMLIAVIIASAGLVANERRSGTVALILTKPLSWSSFVVAKVAAQLLLIAVAAAIAAFVCALFTMGIFGDVPLEELVGVTALWIVTAFLFVGIMVLVQVIVPSTAGAAGIGIAIYAIFSLAGIWQPVRDYTPAGLFGAMNDIAAAGDASVLWPVLFAIPLAIACLAAGIWLFQRQPQTGRAGDM
jgi:ABC-2 type transport system permease protein